MERKNIFEIIEDKYDIKENAKKLEKIYKTKSN